MPANQPVLLTGATGLLGQYLLRYLLQSRRPVAVLVRDSGSTPARERIAELVDTWSSANTHALPMPYVIAANLGDDTLDLGLADRHWLFRHQPTLLHTAASRSLPDGEPWKTNLRGTQALLRLARSVGITQWHHVSTAFVCGNRQGDISEEDLDCGQTFANPYEESKFAAERCLHQASNLRVTVYRPSVIVGHSVTGATSTYVGLYRFLEMAAKLAGPPTVTGNATGRPKRSFPLRLPLTGSEEVNLVPVDWVAQAIASLFERPQWHGRTFHLVSRAAATTELIASTAVTELSLEGVELVGPHGNTGLTRLEELFWEGLHDYLTYLFGTPRFLDANTAKALPHLPPPCVDQALLERLIEFAVANHWGRRPSPNTMAIASIGSPCAEYFEDIFPTQARISTLARTVGLDLLVGFDIQGQGGGQWSCRWSHGEFKYSQGGLEPGAVLIYQMNLDTFEDILNGRQTPQQAFFEQRISITGDLELALKLAFLFELFLQENRGPAAQRLEVTHGSSN
jgi:thioester reductase-like protein